MIYWVDSLAGCASASPDVGQECSGLRAWLSWSIRGGSFPWLMLWWGRLEGPFQVGHWVTGTADPASLTLSGPFTSQIVLHRVSPHGSSNSYKTSSLLAQESIRSKGRRWQTFLSVRSKTYTRFLSLPTNG